MQQGGGGGGGQAASSSANFRPISTNTIHNQQQQQQYQYNQQNQYHHHQHQHHQNNNSNQQQHPTHSQKQSQQQQNQNHQHQHQNSQGGTCATSAGAGAGGGSRQQQQQQQQESSATTSAGGGGGGTTTTATVGATAAGRGTTLCSAQFSTRFIPKEKLGQGTYGVVFRCEDTLTGMSVAMKKITEQRPEEGVPSIAIREISLLREVQHPNVVTLLNVVPRDRELVLIFEYVDQDLKKLLDSRLTPFTGQKLKWIMYQLLQGTAACHAKRIVHRDLKPQNLLVSKNEGTVKIADFGLARAFHVTLQSYTKEVVTLWYRAPEILLGEKHYRPAVDVWSLGCIMAELATKRALFPGDCEIHQLFLIFKVFGTPSETSWPGVTSLPQFNTAYPQWRSSDLKNFVPSLDDQGLELLRGMLQLDPLERISAPVALRHPWFDDIRDAYAQQFSDFKAQ